jgi:hypothetical protein
MLKICCFGVAFLALMLSVNFLTGEPKQGKNLTDLKVNSLSIMDRDGEACITMTATESGPGIWLKRPGGGQIFITAMRGHNFAIGFLPKDNKGASFAISQGPDDAGVIQYRDAKGEFHFLDLEKLGGLFGK